MNRIVTSTNDDGVTWQYMRLADVYLDVYKRQPLKDEVFCTGVQNIMGNETLTDSDHMGLIGSWGRHLSLIHIYHCKSYNIED